MRLERENTNDCKEELEFLWCLETQKHWKIVFTLYTLNNFIARHEHSTRDLRGPLISINPVVTDE